MTKNQNSKPGSMTEALFIFRSLNFSPLDLDFRWFGYWKLEFGFGT